MGEAPVILVVEDEESVRLLVTTLLERNGYAVLTARNGAEGLEAARNFNGPISAVLTDYKMPQLDGLQLVKRLTVERPGIRALFISGQMSHPEELRRSGIPLVQKPFSITELLRAVKLCLEAPPPRP